MREIRTSGSMSGEGKRGVAVWPKLPRLSSTLTMNGQARHAGPPDRVRFATGGPFVSSCSPPRIAAAQLLSTSQAVTARGGHFHPADKASSRTHSPRPWPGRVFR